MAKEAFVEKAIELGIPFIETATKRLYSNVFGSGRATRYTDVGIFNLTDRTFHLRNNSCESGGWTSSMLPENTIPARSAVVYGCESHGFMTGCTRCRLDYADKDGRSFYVQTSNPYIGSNWAECKGEGVNVYYILGCGDSNTCHFIVS